MFKPLHEDKKEHIRKQLERVVEKLSDVIVQSNHNEAVRDERFPKIQSELLIEMPKYGVFWHF